MKKSLQKVISVFLAGVLSATMLSACGTKAPSSKAVDTTEAEVTTTTAATTVSAPVELTISAAASLTDVMNDISTKYKGVAPNVTITYNFGASGALQTQIEEGAPADIFMSAAKKQMDALSTGGLIAEDTRKDLLENEIVLITPKNSNKGIKSFDDIATDKVTKIALGEPKAVPVGQYSEEIFTSLNCLDAVKAKAVYGSDVRQVLTWVESGEVDCGIVYATDAKISKDVNVVASAPAGSHKPVVYPVAVLKNSKNSDTAKAFLDYISTKEISAIFEKYGFVTK